MTANAALKFSPGTVSRRRRFSQVCMSSAVESAYLLSFVVSSLPGVMEIRDIVSKSEGDWETKASGAERKKLQREAEEHNLQREVERQESFNRGRV
jgi:hypothetical protein